MYQRTLSTPIAIGLGIAIGIVASRRWMAPGTEANVTSTAPVSAAAHIAGLLVLCRAGGDREVFGDF